jgi:hypothetical protein
LKRHESFTVQGSAARITLPAGRIDWVDWDSQARLVLSVDGTVRVARVGPDHIEESTMLIDLPGDTPERRPAPTEAREW